ncbi:acyl-CoA dehydrogenase [Streptomyces showdoensis]|uniref:Acyl-CoA dehydrogenase n=1 Tax=Streptomyces showdoensis TaxID=68268 RepID=A0A2P2GE41_STREW|nr:acyl-CoA dehydrogenase [Streptomyces showdoensis]
MRPTSAPAERPADDEIWPRVTRELADDLAVDALTRDRAGKAPFDEVARLQEAGLPALLTAPGPSGRGADWRTACGVVREISAADGSIGELLAHHCVLSWTSRFLGPAAGPLDLDTRTADERWLLAGAVEPPRVDHAPAGLTLTPAGGGAYVLDGRRAFASGVTVADRLVVGARCTETGDLLVVLVDPAHPAVFTDAGAERVGQRLAGAGTVTFDQVPVAAGQVLGALPQDEHAVAPYSTLAPLALRLLLVHVGLGIAEGALAEARDISRATQAAPPPAEGARGRAAFATDFANGFAADFAATGTDGRPGPAGRTGIPGLSGAAGFPAPGPVGFTGGGPGDDPYLLLAYGELATAAHAAAAVVERATDALAHGLVEERALGVEDLADIAVLVAAAETVTNRAAVEITTRILELVEPATAARPHAGGQGFDRFWRNVRALTASVSPDHRLRDIGDHYLNGTHARLTLLA